MKKFARLLSMVLAVATVLSLCIGAFDYVDADKITKGKENAINAVYDWGIMQGNDKGEFNPTANLTRDEMSKIMYAMKENGLDVPSYFTGFASTFADGAKVPAWSKGYVGYAYIYNIFVGNEKNEINALGNLSYVEATIVLLRAMDIGTSEDNNSKTIDRYTGANWMNNAIADGAEIGLFNGLDISSFTAAITREDVAVMIYNAVNYAEEHELSCFALAEKVEGVVIGTETDDKKVDYFTLSNNEKYAIGDLDVADYMGKKVSFYVEDNKVVSAITTSATVVNTTVGAIGRKEIDDVSCWTVDDKKLAEISKVTDFYLFKNNTKKANDKVYNATEAEAMLKAEADFQNITLINNGDSISVVYNPIYFVKQGDYKIVKEVVDKKYTGKYYVEINGEKVYVWFSKLEANTYYAFSIDGTELTQEGVASTVALKDVKIKNGKFMYNGKELTLYDVAGIGESVSEDGMISAMRSANYDKWNLIVYNNLVLGWEAVDTTPTHEVADYAWVLDYNYEVSGGKTVYTVKAYVNNELKSFEVKGEDDFVPAKEHIYVYEVLDADSGNLKKGDIKLTDKGARKLTAYGEKDKVEADSYKGKTVVMYDFNTNALMDASKFTVKDGVAKYGDEEYVANAFGYQMIDNDYVLIGFFEIED